MALLRAAALVAALNIGGSYAASCDKTKYSLNGECVKCPAGSSCSGGSRMPESEADYWMVQPEAHVTYEAHRCPIAGSCAANNTCTAGYRGYFCAECAADFHRAHSGCLQCPADGEVWAWLTLLYVVYALLGVLLVGIVRAGPRLASPFLVTVGLLQLSGAVFGPPWTAYGESLFPSSVSFVLANFNLPELYSFLDCLGVSYTGRLVFIATHPFQMVAILALVYVPSWTCRKCTKKGEAALRNSTLTNVYAYLSAYSLYLHLAYVFMIVAALHPNTCVQLGGKKVLRAWPSYICEGDNYKVLRLVSVLVLWLFGLGLPVASYIWARMHRKELRHLDITERQDGGDRHRFFFVKYERWTHFTLHHQFTGPSMDWAKAVASGEAEAVKIYNVRDVWPSVECLYRGVVLIAPSLMSDDTSCRYDKPDTCESPVWQYMPGLVATCLILLVHMRLQPYKRAAANRSATAAYATLLLLHVFAMVFGNEKSDIKDLLACLTLAGGFGVCFASLLRELNIFRMVWFDQVFAIERVDKFDATALSEVLTDRLTEVFAMYMQSYDEICDERDELLATGALDHSNAPSSELIATEAWRRTAARAEASTEGMDATSEDILSDVHQALLDRVMDGIGESTQWRPMLHLPSDRPGTSDRVDERLLVKVKTRVLTERTEFERDLEQADQQRQAMDGLGAGAVELTLAEAPGAQP